MNRISGTDVPLTRIMRHLTSVTRMKSNFFVKFQMTKLIQKLVGHEDPVWQTAWHPTQPTLISCSTDKSIRLWTLNPSLNEFQPTTVINDAHERTIRSVHYHPSGKLFASASFDSTTSIWLPSTNTFENEMVLEGHENEVKCVRWSPSGELLATCSRDKSVWIWQFLEEGDFECLAVLQEHTQDVKGVCWHPESSILASFSYDDTIKIWKDDNGDWFLYDTLKAHSSTVWSASFSPNGQYLVSVGDDLKMVIHELVGKEFKIVGHIEQLHSDPIFAVDWGSNNVIASCGGTLIKFCRYENGKISVVDEIENPHGEYDVNHVAWCKATGYTNYLCSSGDDSNVNVYETNFK